MNPTSLTAILLSSVVCGLSQQAETKVNVRHVIGLENVKRNRAGKLTVQNGMMQFEAGTTDAKVPTAAIDDLSIGSETTQAGGKAGTVAKTAAIAAPYDSGAALSLLLRTKVDILTVSYWVQAVGCMLPSWHCREAKRSKSGLSSSRRAPTPTPAPQPDWS